MSEHTELSGEEALALDEKFVLKKMRSHRVVFAKGFQQGDETKEEAKAQVQKTEQQHTVIVKALRSCYLFETATQEQLHEMSSYMWAKSYSGGDTIMKQGVDEGDFFYVIESGTFDIYVDNNLVTTRSESSDEAYFGELALLYNTPRAATVKLRNCKQNKAVLWVIDRATFRRVLAHTTTKTREEKRTAVLSIPLLRDVSTVVSVHV